MKSVMQAPSFRSYPTLPASAVMAIALGTMVLLAAASPSAQAGDAVVTPAIQAIVDSPDRSEKDRETDQRRQPAKMLAFFGVKPGMHVLDIGTGRGYTAELLTRAVGPDGSVIAQNDTTIDERFLKGNTPSRFTTDVMSQATYVVRPYDDPIPEGAGPFDLITIMFVYHDMEWLERDRVMMNKRFFEAMKPGGHVVVVDHAGNPGTGVSESGTTHRIEESVVRAEFAAAGFELADEADFLRNPDDPRTESFRQMDMPSDRFVLKFRRP